jgi:hypothetical protein
MEIQSISLKSSLKNLMSGSKYYYLLDLIRHLTSIVHWISDGCRLNAPPPIKRQVIKSYISRYAIENFVETGTHLGDTLASIACDSRVNAISIELDEEFYNRAARRFLRWQNVTVIQGDSATELPKVISKLDGPTLFWLDGHYSGGDTGKGLKETPISNELACLLANYNGKDVILIDDIRCFDGTHDYPKLSSLMSELETFNKMLHMEISTDILRLTPKHIK